MSIERVTRIATIAAPAERVFAVLSAPQRTPEWLVGVRSVELLTPGDIRVGSETISQVEALGKLWEARGCCVLLEPPTRIVIETVMGPGFKSRSDSRLEPSSESLSVLHAELAFERPGGPLGLLFKAFGAGERIEQDFNTSIQNLQALIEREQ